LASDFDYSRMDLLFVLAQTKSGFIPIL
jgi:hypothetical protein